MFTSPLILLLVLAQKGNVVKGQQQLAGTTGNFGTTYTLQNNFNFTMLSARYGLEAIDSSTPVFATQDNKIVTVVFSIKNSQNSDNWFNTENLVTFVDDKDQIYTPAGIAMLASLGSKEVNFTLRPGQGLGIPAQKDELSLSFPIPTKARITKIMLNMGRLQVPSEKVLRYVLSVPPAKPDPKTVNYISPLSPECVEGNDPYGATQADRCTATLGTFVPSGVFNIRLDSVSPSESFDGNPPEDGKKFVVMTLTAKSRVHTDQSEFELSGGDFPKYELTDEDNEHYKPIGFRKPKADEPPAHTFVKDEPYTIRIFFALPKDAKPKKAVIGSGQSTSWSIAL